MSLREGEDQVEAGLGKIRFTRSKDFQTDWSNSVGFFVGGKKFNHPGRGVLIAIGMAESTVKRQIKRYLNWLC